MMAELKTTYMGLELRNPVMVASSGLTGNIEGVKKAEGAGAGAVVLKSIFEEQIDAEVAQITAQSWMPGHAEAFDYVHGMGYALTPVKYLDLVSQARDAVSIPVIASLNCISGKWWTDYAEKIEQAGAHGLELNISVMPSDPKRTSNDVEGIYYDIVESVKSRIKIPVAVKLGSCFTALGHTAGELSKRGADALVLFNRFYSLNIDIEKMEVTAGYPFSSSGDMSHTLRWVALLAGRIDADIAASTGIHDASDVVKLILAGAGVVEMASALYTKGMEHIETVLEGLQKWMDKHGLTSLDEFRGRLSQERADNPELYDRLQYIKAIVGLE
ncbi:dihydroorotate dehydrogenase-like protein [candidate division WOR-3 bacterium]|uniref:Dihydroorotate dehydrogenase-like protein n=1 Tax=candidate division WOR-3 bacterium TaxID=2052148 RepID=A0A9D5K856_UNCW3|nr:dihydroorotate dehydrogenase-like protein [candidate division WOR-3 bacterium]MBD3364058.1 dihydroorotate dehydrogenase-like protein [candidate division WOR-3 bacterium]